MRSSKSRSRSKGNRNRSVGNIINRVFDSSGPEGKVRGTPQQIIDKYTQLARDAQLSNDRVAAENFLQHAEHYTRLLGEAMREMEARREQQEREQRERQQAREEQRREQRSQQQQPPAEKPEPAVPPAAEVIDPIPESDSGLVETPEESRTRRRSSRGRKPRAQQEAQQEAQGDAPDNSDAPEAPEAAE